MKGPRTDGYRFTDLEHLTRWLVTTKWGAEVMRDALYSANGARFYEEFVERELSVMELPARPTYVLVKAFSDGWIEVYGERHVRAKVIQLPYAESAEEEMKLEEYVELCLKLPFKEIHYPSSKRAQLQTIPYWSPSECLEIELNREFEQLVIRSLSKANA